MRLIGDFEPVEIAVDLGDEIVALESLMLTEVRVFERGGLDALGVESLDFFLKRRLAVIGNLPVELVLAFLPIFPGQKGLGRPRLVQHTVHRTILARPVA